MNVKNVSYCVAYYIYEYIHFRNNVLANKYRDIVSDSGSDFARDGGRESNNYYDHNLL